MNTKKTILLIIVFALVLVFINCGERNNVAGNVSDVDNAGIIGKLVDEGGNPASGVSVELYNIEYNPSSAKRLASTLYLRQKADTTVITNSAGAYDIPLPQAGTYNIIGKTSDKAVFIDNVVVDDTVDVDVATDTIKAPGQIKGVSYMCGIDDLNQMRMSIYIPGTDYFVSPASGGKFSITGIAEGTYTLFFVPTYTNYYIDSIHVDVISDSVIDLDTIKLYSDSITGQPVANLGSDISLSVNDSFSITLNGSDSYGYITTYRLDSNGDGVFDDSATDSATIGFISSSDTGNYHVILQVEDNDGNTDNDTAIILLLEDVPTVTVCNDTTVSINDTVLLTGLASDLYGTVKHYKWYSNEIDTFVLIGDTNTVKYIVGITPSTFTCQLSAIDDDGCVGYQQVTINVIQDLPIANAGNDTVVHYGTTVYFYGAPHDSFGSIVKYEWDFDGPGSYYNYVQTSDNDTSLSLELSDAVSYFRVTDDDGNTKMDSMRIKVYPRSVNLDVDSIFGHSAYLSWSASIDNDFYSYRIFHETIPESLVALVPDTTIFDIDATQFRINNLEPNIQYFFHITITDSSGLTCYSGPVCDTTLEIWKTKSSMSTAREKLTACAVNGKVYAIGGENNDWTINIVEEYDPENDLWSTKSSMPTNRSGATCCAVNGKIYVFGGHGGGNPDGELGILEEYDPATDSWTEKRGLSVSGWGAVLNPAADSHKIYD